MGLPVEKRQQIADEKPTVTTKYHTDTARQMGQQLFHELNNAIAGIGRASSESHFQ